MKEEIINSIFDINAKCQSMIEEANKIIKVYLETTNIYEEDGRYNLAYDVKNYLPKLLEENKSLQSQLKEKEEVIKEARETIKTKLQKSFAYDYGLSEVDATSKDRLFTETVIELQLIDEILSKGENK